MKESVVYSRPTRIYNIADHISYRWVLVLPFLALLLVSGAIVGTLSFRAGNLSVERMIDDLKRRIQSEVYAELDDYLDEALHLNEANGIEITRGIVDPYDPETRDPFFASRLELWPNAAMSFFGDPDGEFYGARRTTTNEIEVVRNNESTGGASRYFSTDAMGHPVDPVVEFPNFDPRTRPWFIAAVDTRAAVFSPVYKHFVFDDLAITASRPIYREDGSLYGVLGVDYLLGRLNSFFSQIIDGEGIVLLAVEEGTDYLIANSEGAPNFLTDSDGALVRIAPGESDNEPIRELSQLVDDTQIGAKQRSNGLLVSQFRFTKNNLSWHIVLSIPESLFLSEIRRIGRVSIAILTATFVLAILLGIYLSRLATEPIEMLVLSAERLAQQEWDSAVSISGTNEIARLGRSFNRMAADLRELVENLETKVSERTAKLEELNRTKDRFFSIIAHDLRGPLTTSTMAIDQVLDDFDILRPSELRPIIEMIGASQKSVQRLLENLLLWARSQRGEISFTPIDIALDEIVAEVRSLVANAAASKNITISYETDSPIVRCDRDMIATVLRNLVSNAIKYSYTGGKITIRATRLETGRITVAVIDQGTGIDPSNFPTLLYISTNHSEPGTEGETGTGLGLVVSREFLERHDTDLDISSTPGEGSSFRFSLRESG